MKKKTNVKRQSNQRRRLANPAPDIYELDVKSDADADVVVYGNETKSNPKNSESESNIEMKEARQISFRKKNHFLNHA